MNLLQNFEVRIYQTEITGHILQTADFIKLQAEFGKTQRMKIVGNSIIFPESAKPLSYDERVKSYEFNKNSAYF